MKTFQVPINHPYIQNLTSWDLEFIEVSTALDNPKIREKLQNTIYDDDFDDYWDETMNSTQEQNEESDISQERSTNDYEDDDEFLDMTTEN